MKSIEHHTYNDKINSVSRILFILASLLLISVFFFPLWKIALWAPQYPEGLSMYIWVNNIRGGTEHDLHNINLLNHYIGMKSIEPQSVPELKIMPYVVVFFILFGLIGAFFSIRFFLYLWVVLLGIAGVAGLVDFYIWLYEYGHNLDPNAPIKIPDMSYQPPIIGTKQLLNITASSFPHIGAFIAVFSFILGFVASIVDLRSRSVREVPKAFRSKSSFGFNGFKVFIFSLFLFFLFPFSTLCSRSRGPETIMVGKDICDYCKMVISDKRFTAEVITKKGKVYKFDSIECMVSYYNENENQIKSVYVADFNSPDSFIDAMSAFYVKSEKIRSPMGMNLLAFRSKEEGERAISEGTGELLDWNSLRNLLKHRSSH